VLLATITCTRQARKEDESKVLHKVIVQKEEAQPPTVRYTPPHPRNNTICNNQNEQPMISLAANIGRVEPRNLKFEGSVKSKNITILTNSRSTHNFVDINLIKQLIFFVYPMKDLMVTLLMVNKSEDSDGAIRLLYRYKT
jgi:hypothetical protein